MELCTVRGISNLSSLNPKHSSPTDTQFQSLLLPQTNVPFVHKQIRFNFGLQYHRNSCLRSTSSDEISTDAAPYVKDEPKSDSAITMDDEQSFDKKEDYGSQLNEAPQEGSLTDDPLQLFKFMEDLNLKFDYEDKYSILVFGGGAAVALWLLAAVVGAIDSIPVFPKVLELIGLGYTIWFSSRYLVFKKNRDELVAKVEQIKQQIIGSEDN